MLRCCIQIRLQCTEGTTDGDRQSRHIVPTSLTLVLPQRTDALQTATMMLLTTWQQLISCGGICLAMSDVSTGECTGGCKARAWNHVDMAHERRRTQWQLSQADTEACGRPHLFFIRSSISQNTGPKLCKLLHLACLLLQGPLSSLTEALQLCILRQLHLFPPLPLKCLLLGLAESCDLQTF